MNTFFYSERENRFLYSSLSQSFSLFSKLLTTKHAIKQSIDNINDTLDLFNSIDTEHKEHKARAIINAQITKATTEQTQNIDDINKTYSLKKSQLHSIFNTTLKNLYTDFIIKEHDKKHKVFFKFENTESIVIDNRKSIARKSNLKFIVDKIYLSDIDKTTQRINKNEYRKFKRYGIVSDNIRQRIQIYLTNTLNKVSHTKQHATLRAKRHYKHNEYSETFKRVIPLKKGYEYLNLSYIERDIKRKIEREQTFFIYSKIN